MNDVVRLSQSTRAYLDGICFASNFFWTEAGMSYELLPPKPEERDFAPEHREKMRSGNAIDFYAGSHDQLAKLSWFLHGALGHSTDTRPSPLPISTVSDGFLSRLNVDINADWFRAEIEEDDFGMDIRLLFADENDQVLCELKMTWRID